MKYFLHDTGSFNDAKITKLFIKFGYEGLGLFYTILEKIANQEKPIETDVLKHQLGVGKKLEKCWQFMEEIDLISSNNGETFNERILSYSESYKIKKEKTKEKVAQWRENQHNKETVTGYNEVSNPPKVKESKVKESNIQDDIFPFAVFWDLYDKKVGKPEKIKDKWAKISDIDREKILAYIPLYIKSQPEKKYRKNPQTFLNNESWNDELIPEKTLFTNGFTKKQPSAKSAGALELLEEIRADFSLNGG